ncbi:hypothetical protein H0H93_011799 [Arthromyces matolae]|nr:hypothetical protein H0H93_011799 [Arthromyces matolae]
MLSRLAVVLCFLAVALSVNALSNVHINRAISHRALARRSPQPNVIRKRSDGKRCKVRASSIAASLSRTAAALEATTSVTSTEVEPTTTSTTTTEQQPTPTTTKAHPTTTTKEQPAQTTTKAHPTTTTEEQPAPTTTKAIETTTTHKVTSTTTSSKAAATTAASSNTPSFLVGTQTGQGTFYSTGLGACGITNTDSDYIAAVSWKLFDNFPGYNGVNPNDNPLCGKKVKVNYNGKTVTVALTDRCTGCDTTDLDFSPAAFDQLSEPSVGRIYNIQWDWLD